MPEPAPSARGRRFALLAGGEAVSRIIGFGVTVYLARVLGASGYGVIALASAILLYLNAITDAGLDMLGVRDVASDPSRLPVLVPPVVAARLAIAAGLWVVAAFVGLVLMPQPEGAVFAAYAVSLTTVAAGTKWVHLGLERPGHAAVSMVAGAALSAVLILLLVHGIGDLGRWPALQFAGDALTALVFLVFLHRAGHALVVRVDWSVVHPVFRRSWPLVAHALLGLVIFNIDFIFLRVFRDAATVGQYAVAYTLISFLINLGFAFSLTLLPVMTRLVGAGAAERDFFGRAMAESLAGGLPVAAGGWLLGAGMIALMFGSAYAASAAPLLILLGCLPVTLMRNVAQSALVAHGRQEQVLRSVVWAAVANISLNFALIPKWGMLGAASATLATEIIRTVLALRYVSRVGLAFPPLSRFGRVVAASVAMAIAVRFVPVALGFRIGLGVVVYAACLAATGALRLGAGGRPELRL